MTDKPISELIHGELNCETAAKDNPVMWRCFHCSEAFRFDQQKEAAEHFGKTSSETPVCQLRIHGEKNLIAQLRKYHDELQEYRNNEGPYLKIIEGMEAEYKNEWDRKEKELRDKYHEGYERLNEECKYLRTFKDMVNLIMARNHVPQNVSEVNRLEWVFEKYNTLKSQSYSAKASLDARGIPNAETLYERIETVFSTYRKAEPEEKQPLTFFTVIGLFAILGGGYFLGLIGGPFNVILPVVAGVGIVSALLWDVFYVEDDEDDDDTEDGDDKERGFMS